MSCVDYQQARDAEAAAVARSNEAAVVIQSQARRLHARREVEDLKSRRDRDQATAVTEGIVDAAAAEVAHRLVSVRMDAFLYFCPGCAHVLAALHVCMPCLMVHVLLHDVAVRLLSLGTTSRRRRLS